MSVLSDEQYRQMARDAGLDLEPTRNMLVEVRGQHAQLINFARAVAEAAIAADRAARAEPIAWATPAGIAAIHAARLGRADNVQVPLSTYPGGDHSVAVYTTPPAAPVATTEEGRHCGDPDCVPCRDPADPAAPVVPDGWLEVIAMLTGFDPIMMTSSSYGGRFFRVELGFRNLVERNNGHDFLRNIIHLRAMLAAAPATSQEPKQ